MVVQIAPRTQNPHVLLVESSPKETEIYSDLVKEVADCKIDVVSRVGSNTEWIAQTNYQLVIIDVSALRPDEGGPHSPLSILERIKRMSPSTSVVIISETASVEEAVAAVRMGAEDYLKKPFNPDAFKLAIKRSLDRKLVFGESDGAAEYLNLLNSCQMISGSMEQEKVFSIIESFFSQELHSNHSAIYLDASDKPVRVDEGAKAKPDQAMQEILDIALYASNPFGKLKESDEVFRFIDKGQLTPGLFIFKFNCAGKVPYFYVCLSPRRPVSVDDFKNRVAMLHRQIEVTGNNIKQYIGFQHLVYVDDATGLYNTRYLNQVLKAEIEKAQQYNHSFAVLFIDADRFKSVNDNHGHLAGTKMLNELGRQLKTLTRENDVCFRYGGDEFVAVLSPCDLETARQVANRIREKVEATDFLEDEGLKLNFTVSIGVALFPLHADTQKSIIEMADHAMYEAKKKSRNCVYIVPTPKKTNKKSVATSSSKSSPKSVAVAKGTTKKRA